MAAYTWTKAIAAGAMLAVVAARILTGPESAAHIAVMMGILGLIFLTVTAALLVGDLKRPDRFLYVLLRPQWRSWLVRGAYLLTAYGAILTLWLIARLAGWDLLADVLLWPGGVLAVLAAVYTAFLFAQAKGRDFWQNPLLSVHLLAHALLAAGAVWLLAEAALGGQPGSVPRLFLMGVLAFSLISLFAEITTMPPTADARLAMDWILRKPNGTWFWLVGIGAGHVLPLALLASGNSALSLVAALAALAGMFVIERLWVLAPQQVPLS